MPSSLAPENPLPLGTTLDQGQLLRSPELVSTLRSMLALAERGELMGAVLVGCKREPGQTMMVLSGQLQGAAVLGELAIVGRLMEDMELKQRKLRVG